MPTWSDKYYLKKPRECFIYPPIIKGIKARVTFEHKFPKHEYMSGISAYVDIIDVIGDYCLAKTRQKMNHIRKNELLTFHYSYIERLWADWEYSRQYLHVKVSHGVFYKKLELEHIVSIQDEPPMSYGMVLTNTTDFDIPFEEREYVALSIDQVLKQYPIVEEPLREGGGTYRKIGGIFLEVDTFERDDDKDEWQYHD